MSILDKWCSYDLRSLPFLDINFFGSYVSDDQEDRETRLKKLVGQAYKNFKKLLKIININEDSIIKVYLAVKEGSLDYKTDLFDNMDLNKEDIIVNNGWSIIKGTTTLDALYCSMKRYFTDINVEWSCQPPVLFYFEEKDLYLRVMDELFGILVKPKEYIPLRHIFYQVESEDKELINQHWRDKMEKKLGI